MKRQPRPQPQHTTPDADTPLNLRGSHNYAIMAIDPGETNGVTQMHVVANARATKNKKAVNHAVRRFLSFQVAVEPKAAHRGRMEMLFSTERGFTLPDPYYQYTEVAFRLVAEWIRFRHWAIRHYRFPAHHTFLVLEDWLMPPQIKTRKRETLSPVYVAHKMIGILEGLAWAHEKQGYGPSHVGSIAWITPADRSEEIFSDERLDAMGLLLKPKTRHPHANDATRLALAFARKFPNVPGLLIPYSGEPRPDPFGKRYPEHGDDYGTVHLAEGFASDPADPARPLGKTRRLRGRSGQNPLAEAVKEQNADKEWAKRPLKRRNAFDRP